MNSLSKFNNVEDDKGNKRKALQFMSFDKHGDTNFPFFFDSKLLKDIWTAKDVADLQIALLSVGGKYRTGKTFLLNLFVHLLQFGTLPENLDLNDTTSGFQWQGGSTAVTDGIWIINKPFILEKPDGTKIALFLMDTEGTDEPNTSSNVTNTIFSMSALLSSFQILNIKYPHSREELEKLHLLSSLGEHCTKSVGFIEGAKIIAKEAKNKAVNTCKNFVSGKSEAETSKNSNRNHASNHSKTNVYPFQNLLFLIRDYLTEEIEEGNGSFKLGKKVLEEYLKEDDSQTENVRDVRRHIKKAFESIECYVVRNPGEKVSERSAKSKPLMVEDLNPDFRGQIKDIFDRKFSVENIPVKKINGQPVTCSQLYEHSQVLLKVFKSGKVPQAVDIVQATDDSTMTKAREAGKKEYNTQMDKKRGKKYMKESDLKRFHKECKLEVMQIIEGIQCLGSEENRARHFDEFKSEIEKEGYIKQLENNRMKSEMIKGISKILGDLTKKHEANLKEKTSKPMSKEDFVKLVDSEKNKTLEEFKKATTQYDSDLLEQPLDDLAQKLMLINALLINNNQNNLEKCRNLLEKEETELTEEYDNSLHEKCYQQSIEPLTFLQIHQDKNEEILTKFDDRFKDLPDFLKKPARESLVRKIKKKKSRYEENNSLNLKKEKKDLEALSDIENNFKDQMLEKINGVFVKPEEIDSFHIELKTRALYYAKRKMGESFDKHESDLITVLNFAKDDFQFANDNLKKKAVAQFKQKMESCYDEYDSEMKKLSIKPQYNTDIQVKHNRCKDEAVDEYQKIEAEPLDEFRSVKSKLEEKIDNRLKLYEKQNTMYKKTEDQNEEQAWNDAESDFKLKIKKTMNKNSRTKSHKVRELYLEHTNELIREYRRKVPTRFYYKEEELKEKFKTIFEEEEEAGRCVVM